MAPHWKCGSGQPVAGSNPALSATCPPVSGSLVSAVTRLDVGEFTFPADEPWPGETGVVVAYLVRHRDAIVLFDTGLGFDSPELDARYHPRPRHIDEVLAEVGLAIRDIDVVVNCHLHADHAGQNALFQGTPIYVQPAERAAAREPQYTIGEWVDGPGVEYRPVAGDHEILPGIQVVATPGHTAGHQSLLVVTAEGPTILAGQAVYSVGEWTAATGAREGRSTAPDTAAYDASVAKLRAFDPVRVWFGHDRITWQRGG
jgi:N-acyl homoserine lactone hydrolase